MSEKKPLAWEGSKGSPSQGRPKRRGAKGRKGSWEGWGKGKKKKTKRGGDKAQTHLNKKENCGGRENPKDKKGKSEKKGFWGRYAVPPSRDPIPLERTGGWRGHSAGTKVKSGSKRVYVKKKRKNKEFSTVRNEGEGVMSRPEGWPKPT